MGNNAGHEWTSEWQQIPALLQQGYRIMLRHNHAQASKQTHLASSWASSPLRRKMQGASQTCHACKPEYMRVNGHGGSSTSMQPGSGLLYLYMLTCFSHTAIPFTNHTAVALFPGKRWVLERLRCYSCKRGQCVTSKGVAW
jgi:hypothetical protein